MTTYILLEAIGMINDDDVLDAKKNSQISQDRITVRQQHTAGRKRAAIGLAAAAAVILCTFGTAMAVSENFRSRVFEFFRISQTEDVPDFHDSGFDNSDASISEGIHAYYLELDNKYEWDIAQNGLLNRRPHDDGSRTDFFSVEGNRMHKVECRETKFEFSWKENAFSGSVLWGEANGKTFAIGNGGQPANDQFWYTGSKVSGDKEAILYFSVGRQEEYDVYPAILNLESGEIKTIFDSTTISGTGHLRDVTFSDDCHYAILWNMEHKSQNVIPYFCNIAENTTVPLSELAGAEINNGAYFIENTLIMLSLGDDGTISCWAYDPMNNAVVKTIDHIASDNPVNDIRGLGLIGGRFALLTDEYNHLSVVDLLTGNTSNPIEGFEYDENMAFNLNAGGNRAFCFTSEHDVSGIGISQLGMIDFEAATFTLFDREGFENNYEYSIGWLDDTRVYIFVGGDGAGLYIYDFG